MSFIPIASFFSLQFATLIRWGRRSGSAYPSLTKTTNQSRNYQWPAAARPEQKAES
jgi:hypothetical protein